MDMQQIPLTDPDAEREDLADILVDSYDIDRERIDDDLDTIAAHTEVILEDHGLECTEEYIQMVQAMILEKMVNAAIRGTTTVDSHLSRFEQDLRTADQFRGTLTMVTGLIGVRSDDVPEAVDQVAKLAYTEDGL